MAIAAQNVPKTGLRIYLVRHGKPLVNQKGWVNKAGAADFFKEYDLAEVEQFDRIVAGIEADEKTHIFCSPLPRAQHTAKQLFGGDARLDSNPVFREFERVVIPVQGLKLPISVWVFLSRIWWLLGFKTSGSETFAEARQRSKQAAELLEQQAKQTQKTVLVAHGLVNAFIAKYLKQRGWQVVRKARRNAYLGVTELYKP